MKELLRQAFDAGRSREYFEQHDGGFHSDFPTFEEWYDSIVKQDKRVEIYIDAVIRGLTSNNNDFDT